jgi:hypothetical protein
MIATLDTQEASRDFCREQYGTQYVVSVTLGYPFNQRIPVLQVRLSWHTGYGGGSRLDGPKLCGADLAIYTRAACSGEMLREIYADALQEAGYDVGIVSTVRGDAYN